MILFTYIVQFSSISSRILPLELVKVLNMFVGRVDQICSGMAIEKINTIGTAKCAQRCRRSGVSFQTTAPQTPCCALAGSDRSPYHNVMEGFFIFA